MISSSSSGRSVRDPEATKQQILDAAEAEFSRRGLQGGRIEAIARSAGITTAMIHYYFENKEGLYKSVLRRPALEACEAIAPLQLEKLPPKVALEKFIRTVIAYEAAHPQRCMLWFQEANQNQGEYFKLLTGHWADAIGPLIDILERGMAEGSFRALDPWLTTVHILGACIFYFNIHENWKHLMPEVDRLSPAVVEQHAQESVRLILAGILNHKF
uniref:Transcriptional regulator, TetR family n=1 Tax=Cyanothece sp. (strain PCC 7425 / ATCC 29141) TaxID=395961 RepID=B8HLR3_CYAP4